LATYAKDRGLGMWKMTLPYLSVRGEVGGGIVKVLSPSRLVIVWSGEYGSYNTTPRFQIQLAHLVPPPKHSRFYAKAMGYLRQLQGELKTDLLTGRVDFKGRPVVSEILSFAADGTAVCSMDYSVYYPVKPGRTFQVECHDCIEEILLAGLAHLDGSPNEWRPGWSLAQEAARMNHVGIWSARQ